MTYECVTNSTFLNNQYYTNKLLQTVIITKLESSESWDNNIIPWYLPPITNLKQIYFQVSIDDFEFINNILHTYYSK